MVSQATLDPKTAVESIGREYVEADTLPGEGCASVREAYRGIAETVERLFGEIPVPVRFQAEDPYDDYQDMAESVGREQMLRVYASHADENPHLSAAENLMFRAVHDWHGHLAYDVDFSSAGEFKKWQRMCRHFTNRDEKRVMFAEVVGQVGAVHYLPDGFADDRYRQRGFMAPWGWISQMRLAVE